jgi:hypothetical protein
MVNEPVCVLFSAYLPLNFKFLSVFQGNEGGEFSSNWSIHSSEYYVDLRAGLRAKQKFYEVYGLRPGSVIEDTVSAHSFS